MPQPSLRTRAELRKQLRDEERELRTLRASRTSALVAVAQLKEVLAQDIREGRGVDKAGAELLEFIERSEGVFEAADVAIRLTTRIIALIRRQLNEPSGEVVGSISPSIHSTH